MSDAFRDKVVVIWDFLSQEEVGSLMEKAGRLSNWKKGRQGTGYEKCEVAGGELRARALRALGCTSELNDTYILRYPPGSYAPWHVDPAPDEHAGRRHRRLNVLLTPQDESVVGGLWINSRAVRMAAGDAVLFYPDRHVHQVGYREQGTRYVFSVGCLE